MIWGKSGLAFTELSLWTRQIGQCGRSGFKINRRSGIKGTRWNSSLPERTDKKLTSNSLRSRIPSFPFGKDISPTIIPKADSPRVGKNMSFAQLIETLKNTRQPELLYMAESHRLYFITSIALTFVACYNLFDLADRSIRGLKAQYDDNEEDLPQSENIKRVAQRGGLALAFCSVYALTGFLFAAMPTRLVRRIEYVPGAKEHIRLVTHPWIPGRLSPVYTIPLENLRVGKRAKVWTGGGFYGTANKSSYFFFLFEKGHRVPWIVDRNGWFWGDGRVFDVIFGKEPVDLAERGLSYDDVIRIQNSQVSKKKAELRRQLGPAWQLKMAGNIMKEDAKKISEAARRAVQESLKNGDNKKSKALKGSNEEISGLNEGISRKVSNEKAVNKKGSNQTVSNEKDQTKRNQPVKRARNEVHK